ncbi:MAG: pyridoxamine 5'-phosphate oxidase family protein, partial [Myxococcota bacterium]
MTMELPGWNRETSPYHRGEQELQDRLGRKELQERMARRIQRPFMPEQHRTFFEQLSFMIAGSVDGDGWPWASMLFGPPGFVSTPDDTTLLIDARPIPGDPIAGNLVSGA